MAASDPAADPSEILRPHAEVEYAAELAALDAADDRERPPNWRLSPWAVVTYLMGGELADGTVIVPKYIGRRRLMEVAVATLATDRALLLLGVPGTAKTWVSEHLAAAISGDSTLLVQGTAGTTEETLRYGWNYARLIAEGPTAEALVPSPIYRAMDRGSIARVEELTRIGARTPLTGRGVNYIGPTILEFGTDDQKARWLPQIARGDGAWAMSMSELMTAVRHDIPVTSIVFHNRQWGAEKKNQVDFYGRRFVAGELEGGENYAEIARSMGAEGVRVDKIDNVGAALTDAIDAQMNEGKTTVIEIMCTKELGDPFRKDALKTPTRHLDKYKDFV